jgi:hypothetical protein
MSKVITQDNELINANKNTSAGTFTIKKINGIDITLNMICIVVTIRIF